jgi:Holliday junction resolvase
MTLKVPYVTGYRAEREAKKMLEEEGYYVMASRGSHGIFDLAAFSNKDTRLISLKVIGFGERRVFKDHQTEIRTVPVCPFVRKELWVYEKRRGWHYYPC